MPQLGFGHVTRTPPSVTWNVKVLYQKSLKEINPEPKQNKWYKISINEHYESVCKQLKLLAKSKLAKLYKMHLSKCSLISIKI